MRAVNVLRGARELVAKGEMVLEFLNEAATDLENINVST